MTLRRLLRELLLAFLVGTAIFFVFRVIEYFNGARHELDQEFVIKFFIHQVYSVALYMANMVVIIFLLRRYGKELFKPRKLLLAGLGSVGITMSTLFILNTSFISYRLGVDLQHAISIQGAVDYWPSLLISVVITAIFYGVYYYKNKQERKVKEQKIIAGAASAQFDALKNQLDPHFLFNSLNVLTSLIEEAPHQAQKFTTSLSKVYRYVLEQKNKELVTVDEELKFARTYVSLLKMRFEDSIVFDIPERASDPETKVVPLSLQLLLENAVKHNSVTPSKPLRIKIEERGNDLVIHNNLQPKQVVKKGSGVGLRNIQQRYAILSDRTVDIQKTGKGFAVSIPMLTHQVSTAVKAKPQENYLEDKRYQRARERVEALKNFYGNLMAYCIVIPILWYINYRTSSFIWAIFPTLGWGFAVFMHWMEASGRNPFMGKNWEQRKIREYMDDEEF